MVGHGGKEEKVEIVLRRGLGPGLGGYKEVMVGLGTSWE